MDELIGQEVEVIWMDENSIFNGGTGAESSTLSTQAGEGTKTLDNYLDGFRIYNPISYNDKYIVSEQGATYYSVIDAINAGSMGNASFAGYLEGGAEGTVFADYFKSGGPKYEVYLKNGKSLAFSFNASSPESRVMISLRAASGTAKAKIGSVEFTVNNASETYFDITDYVNKDSNGIYTVTVTNTGTGLLAVDNIKLTSAAPAPISNVSLTELSALISTQAVEIEPGTFGVEVSESKYPDYTPDKPSVSNPDPNLDIEGSIPDYDEYKEIYLEETKTAIFEMIVDFLMKIVEFIKHFIQVIPTVWTRGI